MPEQARKTRVSFICTINSLVVTQPLAQAGGDTVIVDQEYGAVGLGFDVLMLKNAATVATDGQVRLQFEAGDGRTTTSAPVQSRPKRCSR